MNNAKSILLFFLLCVFSFLQAQVQEYDLNSINTIKDAESYYTACMAVPFRDDVSKDDIYEMLKEQSNDAGLTMSGYITRLILEKDTEKRVREQIEKERIIESQMNSSEQK